MRKLLYFGLCLIMVLAFVGCGEPAEEQPEEQIDYEIALVTDTGLIMDGGYSEVAWNAISDFGAKKGISHKYYKAADGSEASYEETIDDAVARGAKVVIADGYDFENVIYKAQTKYEDVSFILIDAEPIDGKTGEKRIGKNTEAVIFDSEEAGFLAGYAAVEDGCEKLGFIGEAQKNTVEEYLNGFIQGADLAASENEVSIEVKYHICDESHSKQAVLEKAASLYDEGTDVIMAVGNQVEMPVIEAAELKEKKVIACETNKSGMSDRVLTSVEKDIKGAVTTALDEYFAGKFNGGNEVQYDISTESIYIDLESSRFTSFGKADYEDVCKLLTNKLVKIKKLGKESKDGKAGKEVKASLESSENPENKAGIEGIDGLESLESLETENTVLIKK